MNEHGQKCLHPHLNDRKWSGAKIQGQGVAGETEQACVFQQDEGKHRGPVQATGETEWARKGGLSGHSRQLQPGSTGSTPLIPPTVLGRACLSLPSLPPPHVPCLLGRVLAGPSAQSPPQAPSTSVSAFLSEITFLPFMQYHQKSSSRKQSLSEPSLTTLPLFPQGLTTPYTETTADNSTHLAPGMFSPALLCRSPGYQGKSEATQVANNREQGKGAQCYDRRRSH